MLSVVSNLSAMNAQRQFNITGDTIRKSTEKLSSGYKINRAADDAAGLTISEKMRSLIRGMNQGSDNIQDGISVMQIADGALAEVHGMLHRMTELSIKAANGTNTAADRQAIQSEINELSAEITRIGETTTFNTMRILDNGKSEPDAESAAELVKCKSADKGFMGESYEYGGSYYPAAILDFSSLNESRIKQLDDKSFSFVCGFGCGETFKFTFKEGTESGKTADTINSESRGTQHNFYVGTSGISDGAALAQKLYQTVVDNPIGGHSGQYLGGEYVSHAASFVNLGGGKLAVVQGQSLPTAEQAANYYPVSGSTTKGKMDCSEITNSDENLVNRFRIQCSNIVDDCEYIETYRMNSKVLGVDHVDVSTEGAARGSIIKIERALAKVSEHRSAYGAFQNRLEHSYDNNNNKAENMTAAESRIRDTDMSAEMMKLTTANILSQAGSAMLSQTMQNPQSVLSLLQ